MDISIIEWRIDAAERKLQATYIYSIANNMEIPRVSHITGFTPYSVRYLSNNEHIAHPALSATT
jgi:hypothetical protein